MNYDKIKLVAPRTIAMTTACEPVHDIDEEVRPFIPYLIRTMRREDGLGITANQIGINKAVSIINVPGDHIHILINPKVERAYGASMLTEEGCLSFKGKVMRRQRKRHVAIRALNLKGEWFLVDTSYRFYPYASSMLLSACLQHEMDHINGIDMRPYL